jgi:serine/threonine protein kinase
MADGAEFNQDQGMPSGQPRTAAGDDHYFQPGMHVNKTYEIIGLIGHGVYGSVYKVRHLFLGKEMALKVLRTDRVSETAWLKFQAEAAALRRLNHPNVVRIFDLGLLERTMPFYAMELLSGHSLETILQRKKILTLEEALPVFRQVSAGLAYVHEHQIIHRDLKPANIIVNEHDTSGQMVTKLIDFGVAKLTGQGEGQTAGHAGEGNIDPSYMSPEQCAGGDIDNRSDIYSLGVIIFQTLTGTNPFRGSSPMMTSQRHQALAAPTMCEASDGVDFPPQLEALVASMLAKETRNRPKSAAEVVAVLTELEKPMVDQTESLKEGQITTRVRKPYQSRKSEDGDGDGADGARGGIKKMPKPVLAAVIGIAAISLVGMLGAGGYYIYANYGPKQSKAELQAQALKKANEERLRMDSLYKDELKKGPFFQGVVTQGGKQFSSFSFPERFSMGDIELMEENGANFRAQGKVLIPAGPPLHFYPNEYCLSHSEVLKRFEENDLQAITLIRDRSAWVTPPPLREVSSASTEPPPPPSLGDTVIKNFAQIKALTYIDLGGTGASDVALEVLNRMPKLAHLNLCKTSVTGEALAEASLLPQLETLEVGGNSDISKVLQKLRYTTVIKKLVLDNCKLSGADFIAIGTMKKLTSLRIAANELKDADIESLKELPNLSDLAFLDCGLTPECGKYLAGITNLKDLSLTTEGWTKEQGDKFNLSLLQSLPEVSVHLLAGGAGATGASAEAGSAAGSTAASAAGSSSGATSSDAGAQ